jgi:hippurate hydrolase
MSGVIAEIAAWADELTALRRDIHAHPEIGFSETRTAALVAAKLRAYGLDEVVEGVGGTGVVGLIKGRGGGRTVGLRADMDALPMDEMTNLPYASKHPGAFHGCGHDGHTTMLLAAARYLAQTRDFSGSVRVIFQPAEEGLGGARAMIADGLFERFPCDEIYALHNSPYHELGVISATPGPAMASASVFDIEIEGKGAHGAMPHQSADPVMAAVAVAQALQTVVARNVDPLSPAVLSVTQIHAGSAYNVIPETASLRGTMRAFDEETRQLAARRIVEIAESVAKAFGARCEAKVRFGAPAVMNDPALTAGACDVAAALVGEGRVRRAADPMMGSEDFADMLQKVPGAYVWLGQGIGPGLHNPGYNFNDAAAPIGASLLARIAQTRAI